MLTYDVDLRSTLLTLGKTQTSLILLSLNRNVSFADICSRLDRSAFGRLLPEGRKNARTSSALCSLLQMLKVK